MRTLTHLLPPSSYYLPLLQSVFSSFIVPSSLPSAAFHSVHTLSSSLSPFLFRSGPFPSHLSKIPFQGTHIFNFPPCWQLQRYKSLGNDILVGCCLLSTLTPHPSFLSSSVGFSQNSNIWLLFLTFLTSQFRWLFRRQSILFSSFIFMWLPLLKGLMSGSVYYSGWLLNSD